MKDSKPVLKIKVPKIQNAIVATTSGKVLRRRIKADGTPENVPIILQNMQPDYLICEC